MDKVSTFAQNDAGASLQKIATTLDTKNIASLTTALKSQSDLFTGDAAKKSIESKVVETEKAVADVVAADKAAADKIAADKAAADKLAADKAAADKIAADKAAADKLAADKAAADKIAADKIAADKIAADKAAADAAAHNSSSDTQNNTTPSKNITVSDTGTTDASTTKTTFNFLTGNYTYSIANFSADDSLIFPMGQTITIKNEDLTDTKVELHWASKGNEITVVLTGLTADQDKTLLFASDINKQFGSTALTYKTTAPTSSNTAQNITVSTDGSQNATTGNIAFNILAGDYNFTIADFAEGDSLHFPTGHKPSVLNTSFTDGKLDLHWTSIDGKDAIITLTGLTDAQDKALLFTTSFDTLFGVNTLSYS